MPKHPGRTALYRLYAKRKRLLYVGISHNPDVRWGQHSLKKAWWPEALRRGATVSQLAKLTGLTAEYFRRIARAEGVERLRPPTVGKLKPGRDDAS